MSNVSGYSNIQNRVFDNHMTDDIKLPKRIMAPRDHDFSNIQPLSNAWQGEKFDMTVPERILVVGQDEYYGTTAPPLEVVLENSAMPSDQEMIRVQTPPRVLTLSEQHFPSEDEDFETNPSFSPISSDRNNSGKSYSLGKSMVPSGVWPAVPNLEGSGDGGRKGLLPSEELSHLRTQMAKLNRRLLALELDNNQRAQREKMFIALGLSWFFIKFLFWINK